MKRSLTAAVLAALVLLPIAYGEAGRTASISKDSLSAHITYLASDQLAGRGLNSKGIDLAAEYIAQRFLEYGLVPGGDQGSYFQWFDVSMRSRITEQCHLEVIGGEITCKLNEDFTPMPYSSSDKFEGPVAFVGYGVANQDKNYDDYADIDVTGKVALMLRYEPDGWKADNGGSWTEHATFPRKLSLARQGGAIAVVIVNPPNSDSDELYSFRAPRSFGQALPMFHITRKLANQMLQAGGLDSVETFYHMINEQNQTVSVDLANITLKGDPGLETSQVKAKNVIGILPGEGPLAQEYVVFGGHYDHLGTVPPRGRPQLGAKFNPADAKIHNGADDNASGTAGVMELARVYASGPSPKRSLVFMGFSGEEIGLLGSAHFVEHPTVPLENIVAMFNLDMIGRLGDRTVQMCAVGTAKEFARLVEKNAEAIEDLDVRLVPGMSFGSDHESFYGKDIPVLFAFSGMHMDYHKPSDDYDKIDYGGAMRILQLVQAVADDVIAADHRPTFQKVARRSRFGLPDLKVRMGFTPGGFGGGEEPGLGVIEIRTDGPAAQAGMKAGDRIIAINKQQVKDFRDYMTILVPFKPGDKVDVTVKRDDRELTLKVKLGGR